jgi:hypothetical protein
MTVEQQSDFFADYGIEIIPEVGDLLFNGGRSFDPQTYRDWLADRHHEDANRFEQTTARFFSLRGEKFLGLGDESTRDVLIPHRRDPYGNLLIANNTGADLLSVVDPDKPSFCIREVKKNEGLVVSIKKAHDQIASTLHLLLQRVPNAEIVRLEVVMPVHGPEEMAELIIRQKLEAVNGEPDLYRSGDPTKGEIRIGDDQWPVYVHFIPLEDGWAG